MLNILNLMFSIVAAVVTVKMNNLIKEKECHINVDRHKTGALTVVLLIFKNKINVVSI